MALDGRPAPSPHVVSTTAMAGVCLGGVVMAVAIGLLLAAFVQLVA